MSISQILDDFAQENVKDAAPSDNNLYVFRDKKKEQKNDRSKKSLFISSLEKSGNTSGEIGVFKQFLE